MTNTTFSVAPSMATDAAYRAWIAAFITALTTVGVVQTSDTGQVNTSTQTLPGAVNTAAGYAIFRFNDTLQSTRPIFFKLEFASAGHSTVASGLPSLFLTVGKSSDGSGNIGTVLFPRTQLYPLGTSSSSATGTATAYTGVASGGTDWVALFPFINAMAGTNLGTAGHHLPYFMIERVSSGDGVVVTIPPINASGGNSTGMKLAGTAADDAYPNLWVINYSTVAYVVTGVPVVIPGNINGSALGPSTSLAAGSIGPAFPWVVLVPGLAPVQCVNAVTFPGGDAPAASFTSTLNGTSRTYYPIPLSDAHNGFGLAPRIQTSATQFPRYAGIGIRW